MEIPTAPNLPVEPLGILCDNPHCNREVGISPVKLPGGEAVCMRCFRETRWMIKQDENAEMRMTWRR